MRVAVISNNYGETYDGIGAFSKVIYSLFSEKTAVEVFSAKCRESEPKLKRITTFGMSRSMLNCVKRINEFDAIVLEYPFVEWNPLVVTIYKMMAHKARISNIKLYLSVHEYSRVNKLRRLVIRTMVKHSDFVFVSNEEIKKELLPYNSEIGIRGIPTNIYGEATRKSIDSLNKYVFFGLINGTKAFEEMLNGWDKFNKNKKNTLYVLSSSDMADVDKHYGITYIKNADNETAFEYMDNSMFAVLPIKPMIDEKNATFKTGAIAGCICIGKYCNAYSEEEFIIKMNDYTVDDFYEAFMFSKKIGYEDACKMSEKSLAFGEKYNPHHIAGLIENTLIEGNTT